MALVSVLSAEDQLFVGRFATHAVMSIIAGYALPDKAETDKLLRTTTDITMFKWLWRVTGRKTKDEIGNIVWTMTSVEQFKWLCEIGATTEKSAHMTKICTWAILHEDVEAFRWIRSRITYEGYPVICFCVNLNTLEREARPGFLVEWNKNNPGKVRSFFSTSIFGVVGTRYDAECLGQILLRLGIDMRRVLWCELPLTEKDVVGIIKHRHIHSDCLAADDCSACKSESGRWMGDAEFQKDAQRWIREVTDLGPLPGGEVRIVPYRYRDR